MSRNVLIMNSGSLQDHAFASPSAVTPGVISAFSETGAQLDLSDGADTGAGTEQSVFSNQPFFLVQGDALLPRRTRVLDPKRLTVSKKVYAAAQNQVTTVSAIPTGTAGEAVIKVIDLSLGTEQFPRITATVQVAAADTAAQIAGKIVTALNGIKRAEPIATASVSGSNLVLTGANAKVSFTTALDGVLVGATVTGTTAPDPGQGTGAHVAALEESAIPVMYGDEYYVNSGLLGRPQAAPRYADLSKNYNLYVLRYDNGSVFEDVVRAARYQTIYLAIATSGVTGNLDAFFNVS